jgi:hypothetical protein
MDRKNAVLVALMRRGIDRDKISGEFSAFSQPVDDDEKGSIAMARNRRVEIVIEGSEDLGVIKVKINRLNQKYYLPTTCSGDSCE